MSAQKIIILETPGLLEQSVSPTYRRAASFLLERGQSVLNQNLPPFTTPSARFEQYLHLLKIADFGLVFLGHESTTVGVLISQLLRLNRKVLLFSQKPAIISALETITLKPLYCYQYQSWPEVETTLKLFKL